MAAGRDIATMARESKVGRELRSSRCWVGTGDKKKRSTFPEAPVSNFCARAWSVVGAWVGAEDWIVVKRDTAIRRLAPRCLKGA